MFKRNIIKRGKIRRTGLDVCFVNAFTRLMYQVFVKLQYQMKRLLLNEELVGIKTSSDWFAELSFNSDEEVSAAISLTSSHSFEVPAQKVSVTEANKEVMN